MGSHRAGAFVVLRILALTLLFNLNCKTFARKASSYEMHDHWSQAVETYNQLISDSYKKENKKIISHFMKNGADNLPQAPKKLYFYYHRLAESMLQLYLHHHEKLSTGQLDTLRKRTTMYIEILDNSDYEDNSYDTIMERLEKKEKHIADTIYHSSWFINASYISFRNQLSIQRKSDGPIIPINSTADGICLDGGRRYQNAFWEFNINGCVSGATMNVDTDTHAAITYQQSGVSSTLFMLGPSAL